MAVKTWSQWSNQTKIIVIAFSLLVFAGVLTVVILAATGHFSSPKTTPRPTLSPDVTVAPPTFEACATPPCFNVGNTCPFPIWINAVNNPASGSPVTLSPNMKMLEPGQAVQLDVPADWPAGRVNAYYKEPTANPLAFDKVEMTVTNNGRINYDITYVDYVALPSSITAGPGAVCNGDLSNVQCKVPIFQLLNSCPKGDGFDLYDPVNQRCLSAGLYCSDPANANKSFCHLLDSTLNQCVSNPTQFPNCNLGAGNTTANVYSCSGYFDGQPSEGHTDGNKWCAALNRGLLLDADTTNMDLAYQNTPYNLYAQWGHKTCGNLYFFAYDDYNNSPGPDRDCATDRLDILFCPANSA
jgi:hypothetical protein